jgi:hypothetical protein
VLAEGLWQQSGICSPAHWLRWKAGVGVAQSEALVRTAERLEGLPVTSAAFGAGRLSLDQVAVIARTVPPAFDRSAATLASGLMVPQLQSALRRYRFSVDDAPPAEPDTSRNRRRFSGGFGDDGWYRLSGSLPPEEGAVVQQALDTAYDSLSRRHDADADTGPVSGADALVHLCDLAAANPDQARSVRDRYRVLLHLDAETLEAWESGRRPRLHLGPWLGRAVVEQVTCDTTVRAVLEERGVAVAYGPSHPTIPDRIRRRVEDRDQRCRAPGCRNRRVDLHHLRHRAHGGWTTEANLVCLCRRHHTAHHRGELQITGDPTRPDGLRFHTADGRPLVPARPDPPPEGPSGQWAHPPGYRLQHRWLHLDPDPPPEPRADPGA